MLTHPRNTVRPHTSCRREARRHPRRGAVTLLAIWSLMIFLLMAAWVLNYNFLVLVNRNMQQKSDVIALAAAPALLDEDVLRGAAADQTDDFAEAEAVAGEYRELNNRIQSPAFCLRPGDVRVESGYVADVSGNSPYRFDTSIPLDDPAAPHNTLHVCCRRLADGDHPVQYILDFFHGEKRRAADVASGAYATLDNLVVGFRPKVSAAAPVMPLAISITAWNMERAAGSDCNGNGIREMVLRLQSPDPIHFDANAALLFYDGTRDVSVLAPQMADGLLPNDFPPDGILGPVTPTSPLPVAAMWKVDQGSYPGLNGNLASLLNGLAADSDMARVFPLCNAFGGPDDDDEGGGTGKGKGHHKGKGKGHQKGKGKGHAKHHCGDDEGECDGTGKGEGHHKGKGKGHQKGKGKGHAKHHCGDDEGEGNVRLIGFVGARVLLAGVVDHRLTVTIEPTFIIHHTAWTVAPDHPTAPPRNIYLHKLRLSH